MVSARLKNLVDAVAPLFAGEAEVFSTYWTSTVRTPETDKSWIMRQARKEVWDTPLGDQRGLFIGPVEDLLTDFSRIDLDIPRHEILHRMEELYEEFSHYCAFADAYDALLGPGEAKITPMRLKDVPDWAENAALRERRAAIRVEHGAIGERACFFTEGGYCTLFSEGMKLAGNGGADELIARACALVYEDEFGHMCKGIVGLDDGALSGDDWELLTTLSVELAALRLPMRNAQFSYPLGDDRLGMIRSGDIEPMKFDFGKAAAKNA